MTNLHAGGLYSETCKECGNTFFDVGNCEDIHMTGYCGSCTDEALAEMWGMRDCDHPSIDD